MEQHPVFRLDVIEKKIVLVRVPCVQGIFVLIPQNQHSSDPMICPSIQTMLSPAKENNCAQSNVCIALYRRSGHRHGNVDS